MIDVQLLHEYFIYSEGKLYPRTNRHGWREGTPLGSLYRDGYLYVWLLRKRMLVHRVVWALHHGRWPADMIDHIDTDRTNNRIENLREATTSENGCNSRLSSASTTGVKGLTYIPSRNQWYGSIRYRKERYTKRSKDRAVVEAWLITTREQLAGQFANHGY